MNMQQKKKLFYIKIFCFSIILIYFFIIKNCFFFKNTLKENIFLYKDFFKNMSVNKKNEKQDLLNDIEKNNQMIFYGKLEHNFIESAKKVGVLKKDIVFIVNLIESKINFKTLKKGDIFSILVSFQYNKNIKESQVLAVYIHSNKKDYYAIRAANKKFYDQNGFCVSNNFIRFPMSKSYRVSSNFSLRRVHPVTGKITAHKGVDFALPIGTKVLSVGDGKIIFIGHGQKAGNYVVIKHSTKHITRYMHLKKILVSIGQRVAKGEKIAFSGNTGWSTGPHLHYEVWINNRAVNPLKIRSSFNEILQGKSLQLYLLQVKKISETLSKKFNF